MFADPITVTVNAVAKVMPRVYVAAGGPSTFKMGDDEFKLEISHQEVKGRRERHLIRLTQRKIAADPLTPSTNVEGLATCYVVIDNPKTGFTDLELKYMCQGLLTYAGAGAVMDKLLGGEA